MIERRYFNFSVRDSSRNHFKFERLPGSYLFGKLIGVGGILNGWHDVSNLSTRFLRRSRIPNPITDPAIFCDQAILSSENSNIWFRHIGIFFYEATRLALSIMLVLLACSQSQLPYSNRTEIGNLMSDIAITRAENGKTFGVRVGDKVTVRLDESPTTGYRWVLDTDGGGIVSLQSSDYQPASGGGIGSGGQAVFAFVAREVGHVALRFKLWREWEGNSSIIDTVTVDIRVELR